MTTCVILLNFVVSCFDITIIVTYRNCYLLNVLKFFLDLRYNSRYLAS